MIETAELEKKNVIKFTDFPLGNSVCECGTIFRLFSPSSSLISVVIFKDFEDETGDFYPLTKDEKGIWNGHIKKNLTGFWYAYHIIPPVEESDFFETTAHLIADPWSKHVTSWNNYLQFAKTKIIENKPFSWETDTFVAPKDPRDLIIYETHIRDMVADNSARTYVQGIYNDFQQAEIGGIKHLKNIGVNAVEFLPLQKFAYYEPPYLQELVEGPTNLWNPYSKNYWGYMTSFFFAPETIYASDGNIDQESIVGKTEAAINEFKALVKALHKEKISVIMDVVYNHASQYDLNPLKYTAKDHYFRLDEVGHYLNDSWTGNDIKTDAEFSRKIIIESIKYWMTEYHVDGFRFDLAGIIDNETIGLITIEAKKINPNVILIAEPWGGDYKPHVFSEYGWSSWNDRIRNGFKGYDPVREKGFIFGEWSGGSTRFALENFIRGTLINNEHGLFKSSKHTINYLESHDGYTLGDFIRIALNPELQLNVVEDKSEILELGPKELSIAKLAALVLFVSQGIPMIHSGQEWARAKVITDPDGLDPNAGKLDYDSYNKDNKTNWLNFGEIEANKSLFQYYKNLIKLRKRSPALRKAKPKDICFQVYKDPLHITFSIEGESSKDKYDYFISLNGSMEEEHTIALPTGLWELVADYDMVSLSHPHLVYDEYTLKTSSGVILRKLRNSQV